MEGGVVAGIYKTAEMERDNRNNGKDKMTTPTREVLKCVLFRHE